jgi:sec-independent protein translocase protein TatA
MPIGLPELLILLFVVLLVLGPKRLPALGRSLGGGIREFTDSIRGRNREELPPPAEPEPERDARS